MKKIIGALVVITLTILFCTGCEVSNTELANSLDGNMTRLVYSVGYLDSVSTTDIQDLTMNTSYFAGSSYNLNNASYSGINAYRNANYRSNVYNSNLSNNHTYTSAENNLTASTDRCVNCDASITDVVSTTTNSASSSGNAKNTKLGGLCKNCQGLNTSTAQDLTNASDVITSEDVINENTSSTSYFVDISLIETSASDLNNILLSISQKRGIIMLYCTDLRSGNIELSSDDKSAISEYITIIKETINYLNNNSTALSAHINNIKNVAYTEGAQELINAKLIRANEVLKTRYAKLDTCIDSLDAIISILQRNVGIDYSSSYLNNNTYTNTTLTNTNSNIINEPTTQNLNNSVTNNSTTTPPTDKNTQSTNDANFYSNLNDNIPSNNKQSQTSQPAENNTPIINPNNNNSNKTDNTIVNYNYAGSTNTNYNDGQTPNVSLNTNQSSPVVPAEQASNLEASTNCAIDSNCNAFTSEQKIDNSADVLSGLGVSNLNKTSNPKGIGVQPLDSSPITGITYNSTSVNVPKPGTLISSIGLKNESNSNSIKPINTENYSHNNGLKLVDNKNDKITQEQTLKQENITTKSVQPNTIKENDQDITELPFYNTIDENTYDNKTLSPKPLI
ncbi:MAG: hypothetical protein J6J23_03500, partial [Clostridia bacterium]|nr:hypothetical protein [Clostridia bacterium]